MQLIFSKEKGTKIKMNPPKMLGSFFYRTLVVNDISKCLLLLNNDVTLVVNKVAAFGFIVDFGFTCIPDDDGKLTFKAVVLGIERDDSILITRMDGGHIV